jgi:hypothetical protein
MVIDPVNLAFIVANERARISWDSIEMNPYVFLANFRLHTGFPLFEREKDVPSEGYTFKSKITEEMEEEVLSIHWDSLAMIELRRQGLNSPDITREQGVACYQHEETGELGYLCWIKDEDLANLDKAGIEYRVLRRPEDK